MVERLDWDRVNREKRSTKDREKDSHVAGSPEQKTFQGVEKKNVWKKPPPPKPKQPCPICNKPVKDLDKHVDNTHREFRCQLCGKQFKGLFAAKKHIRHKHR